MKLFFSRKRDDCPTGWVEPHDLRRSVAFEEHATLDLDLHAAASGADWNFGGLKNVAAFAIVHRVVCHEAFPGDRDRPLWLKVVLCPTRRGPTQRLGNDNAEISEQHGINAVEKRHRDDLLFVVDSIDPARNSTLADVISMSFKLATESQITTLFVEPDL